MPGTAPQRRTEAPLSIDGASADAISRDPSAQAEQPFGFDTEDGFDVGRWSDPLSSSSLPQG